MNTFGINLEFNTLNLLLLSRPGHRWRWRLGRWRRIWRRVLRRWTWVRIGPGPWLRLGLSLPGGLRWPVWRLRLSDWIWLWHWFRLWLSFRTWLRPRLRRLWRIWRWRWMGRLQEEMNNEDFYLQVYILDGSFFFTFFYPTFSKILRFYQRLLIRM